MNFRIVFAVFASLLAIGAARADTPAVARKHMIVTDSPFATDAGLQMLRAGGSAVDAAIAAQMVLTLVVPESTGIG
ncbi:MAG TPA: gamma-glutamyltransferase, partial [Rhizomicrobium sp.]|nr:gamma-glutamyltransferase [Rhizomicrobium sp.]